MKLYAYTISASKFKKPLSLVICDVTETSKLYKLSNDSSKLMFMSQIRKEDMDVVLQDKSGGYTYHYYTLVRDDRSVVEKIRIHFINCLDKEIDRIAQIRADVSAISLDSMVIKGDEE